MTTDFKMTFNIHVRETGEVVYFKHDGERFDQMNTVKLNADTEYEFRFTFHPALYIDKLLINGEIVKLELLERKKEDEDLRAYRSFYKTVADDVNRRGKRNEILLVLELQNGVFLKFSLQCKMYKAGENNHAHWGQKLAAIDMECLIEQGCNYVTIVKEKYF